MRLSGRLGGFLPALGLGLDCALVGGFRAVEIRVLGLGFELVLRLRGVGGFRPE